MTWEKEQQAIESLERAIEECNQAVSALKARADQLTLEGMSAGGGFKSGGGSLSNVARARDCINYAYKLLSPFSRTR